MSTDYFLLAIPTQPDDDPATWKLIFSLPSAGEPLTGRTTLTTALPTRSDRMKRREWRDYGKRNISLFLNGLPNNGLLQEWREIYENSTQHCEEIVAGFRRQGNVQQYTDHGPHHIEAVKGLVCGILEARGLWSFNDRWYPTPDSLTHQDLFTLLLACNVHDAKMAILGREGHEDLSPSDLASIFLVTNDELAERVRCVSALHPSEPKRGFEYYLKRGATEKRIALMGAILRLADCLDCTRDRVGVFWLILRYIYDPTDEKMMKQIREDAWQWQVRGVSIDEKEISIDAESSLLGVDWLLSDNTRTRELKRKLQDVIGRKELEPCNKVFEASGCGMFGTDVSIDVETLTMRQTLEEFFGKRGHCIRRATTMATNAINRQVIEDRPIPPITNLADTVSYPDFFQRSGSDHTRLFALAFLAGEVSFVDGSPYLEASYKDLVQRAQALGSLNDVPELATWNGVPSSFFSAAKLKWCMVTRVGKSSGQSMYRLDGRFMPYLIWMAEDCFWKLGPGYLTVPEASKDLPARPKVHPDRPACDISSFIAALRPRLEAQAIAAAFLTNTRGAERHRPDVKSLLYADIVRLCAELLRANPRRRVDRLQGSITAFGEGPASEVGVLWRGRKTGKEGDSRVYHIWVEALPAIRDELLRNCGWVIPDRF